MKRIFRYVVPLLVIATAFSIARGESPLGRDFFNDADPSVVADKLLIARYHIARIPGSIRDGLYGAALDDINFALKYFPNHPVALQFLSMVAKLQGKPGLALLQFEKALSLYPQYALTHAQYGAYLVDIGNTKEGIEKLQKAVEMDPKIAAAHALLAKAYAKSGNMDLARQAAEQAKQLGYTGKLE